MRFERYVLSRLALNFLSAGLTALAISASGTSVEAASSGSIAITKPNVARDVYSLKHGRYRNGIAAGVPHWTETFRQQGLKPLNTFGAHLYGVDAVAELKAAPADINEIYAHLTVYPSYTFSGYPTVTLTGPDLEVYNFCLSASVQYRGTATPAFIVTNNCTDTNTSFLINGAFETDYTSYLVGPPELANVLYMTVAVARNGKVETVSVYDENTGTYDTVVTYTDGSAKPSGLITGSRTLEGNHGSTTATCLTLPTFQIDEILVFESNGNVGGLTPSNATLSGSGTCFTGGATTPYDVYSTTSTGGSDPFYGYEISPK